MGINERIDELCERKHVSKAELERKTGLSKGSTAKWKNNNPSQSSMKRIADYFGVSVDYLIGNTDEEISEEMIANLRRRREVKYMEGLKETMGVQIPVFGEIKIPLEYSDAVSYEMIPEEMTYIGQYFGYKVKDNSMSPSISKNDVVIVRKQDNYESGDICLISGEKVEDERIRRLYKYYDKVVTQSMNPDTEPEIIMSNTLKVIGKIVENRKKFD